MISRKTARIIGEVYATIFREYHSVTTIYRTQNRYYSVDTKELYDFLYDNEYSGWFCNNARAIKGFSDTRPLKDFIMQLHTGETQYKATPNWTWEQRTQLGLTYLTNLAEDILNYWHNEYEGYQKKDSAGIVEELKSSLELDGYIYQNSQLLASEEDILDVQEEVGILETLYTNLKLDNKEIAFHHLKLSEEHYISKRWDDAISNSRKFLECVLQEVANTYSIHMKSIRLSEGIYSQPFKVRDYLEQEGLIETKEKEAIKSIYSLLSHTGGHPYMAQNDQARLLRHLGLTISQFVMLRLQGSLSK